MTRRRRVRAVSRAGAASALLLAALAGVAPAQDSGFTPHAQLTLFGGGYFGGTVYAGRSAALTRDVDVDDDFSYGVKLAYLFGPSVAAELGYGRSVADMNLSAGAGQQPVRLGDLTENRYELNVNFYTNPGPIVFYFTLGGGATHFQAEVEGTLASGESEASDTRFSSNAGLGLMLQATSKMALRLDGRWRYTDTNSGDSYYCDIYGFCYEYDNSYYGSAEMSGGITYNFR